MDKLSLFYREVCLFKPVETAAINMQKAIGTSGGVAVVAVQAVDWQRR